ncbi:hypothetical protein LWI29_032591 [Acer saccharum]|uniref:Uncharacterized protein n=1 Tax=Acer saccharum TaxID=4024 RepID=A0AA39RKK3_ACESA|nr:hypothetical protein LWI29_032591 [Acer saccharum]
MAPETETSYTYEVQLRFDKALRSKLVNLYKTITSSPNQPKVNIMNLTSPFLWPKLPSKFRIFLLLFPLKKLCDALTRDYSGLEIVEEYRPGRWSPSFTLVQQLVDRNQRIHACAVMSQNRSPRIGAVKSFGFVQQAAFPVPDMGISGKQEPSSKEQ